MPLLNLQGHFSCFFMAYQVAYNKCECHEELI